MSCGGGFFTPGAAYDAVWDSVKPMTGNFFMYFQYPEFVECVCMLNDGSAAMSIFAQTTTTFPGSR